ncbi:MULTISPECIES: Maf family protein [Marinobacter]|uniref:dTTP/UTP pyrophosphatase n=1 Tax=Marinobacter profundi TaxID=2666256 RepID=A0A2G1UIQ7_9GAMM|nr:MULTISPECIES: Maf family protein [Marinobacter]MBD3655290.1 septum formation inhibitor Maf [Marinobacter sp.]PHQ14386.1 septum formation protein Maf [Marinobacter profundi]
MRPIILASASPRRAELLRQMGLDFTVCPVDIDETPLPGELPAHYVERLAREKAVAGRQRTTVADSLVIGSDTSVVLGEQILGKPDDEAMAADMLRRLSGHTHRVMTAVALAAADHCTARLVTTEVRFRELTDDEIHAYIASGEPMDKAGGYGIQGLGGIFVASLTGSYSAVVGLPLLETAGLLAEAGQPVWQAWGRTCSKESHSE